MFILEMLLLNERKVSNKLEKETKCYLKKVVTEFRNCQGRREGRGKKVKPYQPPSLKKAPGMVLHACLKF